MNFLKQLEQSLKGERGKVDADRLDKDWQIQPAELRPLLAVIRMRDIQAFTHDATGENPLAAAAQSRYLASNHDTLKDVQSFLYKKNAFADTLHLAIDSHEHRFGFWVQALKEARLHSAAAPVATSALTSLGLIEA
jgi:hypothetical protein